MHTHFAVQSQRLWLTLPGHWQTGSLRCCGAAYHSQVWNIIHNSPVHPVKWGAEGQAACGCVYQLERSISCHAKASCRHSVFLLFCFLLILPLFHEEWVLCLCSIVLCGCEMSDKSLPVQQSIPLTVIIKDALKQKTLPHTLLLCDLAVIWKLSAFLCLLSSSGVFVCLLAPTPAMASNHTGPHRWVGRVTNSDVSPKRELHND